MRYTNNSYVCMYVEALVASG